MLTPSEFGSRCRRFERELARSGYQTFVCHAYGAWFFPRGDSDHIGCLYGANLGQHSHYRPNPTPLVPIKGDGLGVRHPLNVGFETFDVRPHNLGWLRYFDAHDNSHDANLERYAGNMAKTDKFTFKRRPTGVFKRILHSPVWLFRARLGFVFGKRFVMLEHIGRRSGKLRQTPLEVVVRKGDSFTVCSGTGQKADWYRNLRSGPAAALWFGSRRYAVSQRFLGDTEAAETFESYETAHPKAAERLTSLMGVSHDGSDKSRIEMAARIPMVEFTLRR